MKFKVRKMEETPYKLLPIELQVTILLKLPVKSLVRFKCVSKNWLTEITSQSFIDLYNHENYPQNHDSNHRYLILVGRRSISSFDYYSGRGIVSNFTLPLGCHKKLNYKIVGSCNGLLCFEDLTSRKIMVYNPITLTNGVMPISAFPEAYTGYQKGFGYDCKSNDYKILWVFREKLAYIFRLKNNTCEEIKYTPTTIFESDFWKPKSSMVYSNNALHWVGPTTQDASGSTCEAKIIPVKKLFHVGSEQFYEFAAPRRILKDTWNIADVRDYLHLVIHGHPGSLVSPSLEIWIMKEYGVQNSWTNLINYSNVGNMFDPYTGYRWSQPNVYVYSKDNQEILIKFGPYPRELFSCNLITRKIKKVQVSVFDKFDVFDRGPKGFYVAPWSPSFVSP